MKGNRIVRCGGCGGWLASSSTPCATCRQHARQLARAASWITRNRERIMAFHGEAFGRNSILKTAGERR